MGAGIQGLFLGSWSLLFRPFPAQLLSLPWPVSLPFREHLKTCAHPNFGVYHKLLAVPYGVCSTLGIRTLFANQRWCEPPTLERADAGCVWGTLDLGSPVLPLILPPRARRRHDE